MLSGTTRRDIANGIGSGVSSEMRSQGGTWAWGRCVQGGLWVLKREAVVSSVSVTTEQWDFGGHCHALLLGAMESP